MAIKKIEYTNKLATEELLDVPEENKFTADNANEIKDVVNSHADKIQELEDNQLSVNFIEPLKREDNNISIEQTSLDKWNNSLNNEEVQLLINSSLNPIKEELTTKQNVLTAGNNITIENNIISSNIDLSDYYNKSETDSKLGNKVDNNTLDNYYNKSETDEKITQAISAIPSGDVTAAGHNTFTGYNQFTQFLTLGDGINPPDLFFNGLNGIHLINDGTSMKFSYIPDQENLVDDSIPTWKNIKMVTDNITNNTNELKAKDTQLESAINTNKQNITTNTNDITTIKTQQATQDQQISSNRDLSNQIIEGLKTLRVFNYIGTFNSQTTYKRNDVVDYNNRLFLSKVDNNVGNTPPSDNQSNTYWLLIDGVQASVDLSNYYTKIEVDDKLQDYLAITTFNQTIQQIQTKQGEQDTLIGQKANISDLNGYAKINATNNGEFFIGDKNGKHIWFAQPFRYGGNTYSSINIRNGGTNYFTMEHNFNTNQSIISNPRGSIKLQNIAIPRENNDAANKAYVDTKIASIPNTDLTNYYTKAEVDTKISEVNETVDWEVVDTTSIIRGNNQTTIQLNGKRWVHLQGRFTQYTTSVGRYYNFTPITLDIQNYHYVVRFPIYDWNTQAVAASIECDAENDNLILRAYDTSNQSAAYYLWGDVLVK